MELDHASNGPKHKLAAIRGPDWSRIEGRTLTGNATVAAACEIGYPDFDNAGLRVHQ